MDWLRWNFRGKGSGRSERTEVVRSILLVKMSMFI